MKKMKVYILQDVGNDDFFAYSSLHKVIRAMWELEKDSCSFNTEKMIALYREAREREAEGYDCLWAYDWKEQPFELYIRVLDTGSPAE